MSLSRGKKLTFLLSLFLLALFFGATIRFFLEKGARPRITRRQSETNSNQLTFTKDVAPILFANCVECHRPGGTAPFSLTIYPQVKEHLRDIGEATARRAMPPWLLEPGLVDFVHRRFLTTNQIQTIQRWIAEGAVEGDAAAVPSLPRWSNDWRLGQPDLVLTLPEPFSLVATGSDVIKNFAIPIRETGLRHVRTVEFHSGNRAVHQIVLKKKPAGALERRSKNAERETDDNALFEHAHFPDGHFISWSRATRPLAGIDGMAWRLEPGSELIVQLRMRPSGQPELIQPQIGIYFADKPATRFAHTLSMRARSGGATANERTTRQSASYQLPVDVEALSVYPSANALAKEISVKARTPDGGELRLLQIKEWNLAWQDQYRFIAPVALPKGTVISMECISENPFEAGPVPDPKNTNSARPLAEEHDELLLQVVARRREDLEALQRDTALGLRR